MKKNKNEWKKLKETNYNYEINQKGQMRNVKSKKLIKPKGYSYRYTTDGVTKQIGSINELRWKYFKGEITSELYLRGWKKCNLLRKDIKPYYFVNRYGDVYNAKLDRFLKTKKKKDGYLDVHLRPFYIIHHRLVGLFVPIDNKYKHLGYDELTIDHINHKRDDNRVENLRWLPLEENVSISHVKRRKEKMYCYKN